MYPAETCAGSAQGLDDIQGYERFILDDEDNPPVETIV